MKKTTAVFTIILLIISLCAFPAQAQDKVTLSVSKNDDMYKISDSLYGAFIEDISFACDGGLVSNLVNNNSFEYQFNKLTGWTSDKVAFEEKTENPMNEKNPTYASVTVSGSGSITNLGYTELYDYKTYNIDEKKASTADMGFKEGVEYDFSCYLYNEDFQGTVNVFLDSPSNKKNVWQMDLNDIGKSWKKINTVLTSNATEDGGLTILFEGSGTVYIDFVCLVAHNSHGYGLDEWKYVSLRSDLYTALEQMKPSFVRFPGGCLAEGDSLENLYDWKDTIGPLEEREQFYNLWRDDAGRDYINTMAMGYHEFFQLCDDLNAEALPILNAGLICQGRSAYDDYLAALEKSSMTDSEWESYMTETRRISEEDEQTRSDFTNYIDSLNINSHEDFEKYLDTIALRPDTDEWDAYVQDILDLIEYANGDAQTSYWGALRAANGSEEPFNLKYIGIGNENWGDIYERNFKALYKEIKKEHPEITIISSSGTYLEGEAYDNNWSWINENYTDTIVDEHYYTYDGYLFDNNDRYDSFDREKAHVFVGEYAATASGIGTIQTKSNMIEAVEEASYLTGLERNADVVEMASYAPTFAKINAQCWNVNLIWFDSQEIVLTPSYYVQMMFSNNYGTKYLKSLFANGKTQDNQIYESVTIDEKSQTLYIKLVNASGKEQTVDVNISDFGDINRASAQTISSKYKSACNEAGKNTTYPTERDLTANDNTVSVDMGKYDVTVLRVAYGSNTGDKLYSLPNAMDNMADESSYLPPAIKIGIPCAVAGVVAIAVIGGIATAVVKKKKKSDK